MFIINVLLLFVIIACFFIITFLLQENDSIARKFVHKEKHSKKYSIFRLKRNQRLC